MPSNTHPVTNLMERMDLVLQARGGVTGPEIVQRRTLHGKTWDGGKQKHLSTRIGLVHYPEGDQMGEIDLAPRKMGDKWIVDRTFYDLEVTEGAVGFSYRSKAGGLTTVELEAVDGAPPDYANLRPEVVDNEVLWRGVGDELDMRLLIRPGYVETFKHLNGPRAAKAFRWRVTEDDDMPHFKAKTAGWDASDVKEGRNLEISQKTLGRRALANRRHRYTYEEVVTGRVGKVVDAASRRKDWVEGLKYPVVVDATVQENIGASADDAFGSVVIGYGNNLVISQLDIPLWRIDYTLAYSIYPFFERAGFRFASVAIPQYAVINTGTVTFNFRMNQPINQIGAELFMANLADIPAWDADTLNPGNIPVFGTALIAAPASPPDTGIGDIGNLLEQVVGLGGWESGNALAVLAANGYGVNTAGVYGMSAAAYDLNPALAAQLDVDYTEGSPPAAGGKMTLLGVG